MSEPVHTIEIEKKFDVDEGTPLPDFSKVTGVARVDEPEQRELDAVYLDTKDLLLARAAVALRRRTGGGDAGWHIKTSAPEGKHEYGWPLDGGSGEPGELIIPDVVSAALRQWIGGESVSAIARLRNTRTAFALRDHEGALVAEFVDDSVRATDLVRGVDSRWREWEVELGPAAPEDRARFFAQITDAAIRAGARIAASDSKLQRALGR